MDPSMFRSKCASSRLENIDEDGSTSLLPELETPTESMEFLARSWSLSAMQLSKALNKSHLAPNVLEDAPFCSLGNEEKNANSIASQFIDGVSRQSLLEPSPNGASPPISPRDSEDSKELFLLHHALNPDFLPNQQSLKNGVSLIFNDWYITIGSAVYHILSSVCYGFAAVQECIERKTTGKWLKDLRERKKQEIRTQKAQLHAAVSVVGVATAVAALAASTAAASETPVVQNIVPSKASGALASAAALVASHCIEIAEEMGANRDQILTAVNSAVKARTNGDIMTLTAGAATAFRGAATLKASTQKGYGFAAIPMDEEQVEEEKYSYNSLALNFVFNGSKLLKCTRKGALHWKQVSFYINSNWQVIAKMKSKHMAGAFKKKKKCVVYGVYCDTQAWPGREREESSEQRAYFGIKTDNRIIEFECRSKSNKQLWTDGVQKMLCCQTNMK